ncbi:hypothetical protein ACHMWN_08610 [Pedobacter sp. UC225_61]|uniref:hypothetical protein n=1 Tax=Pedobacter sp. UC225_61 TaxID=3374623 RepID=UPI0037AC84DB
MLKTLNIQRYEIDQITNGLPCAHPFGVLPAGGRKKTAEQEKSFLPMQVGNLWQINAQNFTQIQDTLSIGGNLYFKFHSLIGGDAVDTKYLRIDGAGQLLEAYPNDPGNTYLHACFNGKLGEEFFTLKDGSENDYKVRIIEKTPEKMTFEFEMVYHPKLKGDKHTVSYVKGIGLQGKWNKVVIGGRTVKGE